MKNDLSILTHNSKVNILLLILLNDDAYSFLPEINDIFGEEAVLKFLDIFSGTTIKVPNNKKLNKSVLEVEIFSRIEYSKYEVSYKELAKEYSMREDTVERYYLKIKDLLKNYNHVVTKIIK